ncbi:hypothetical protein PPERSA_05272 [Pseudocohnilembus persalinus]|uniref:VWFA domain-containing protein n=1 Tax=Pseudocohnilembus persalinus TaxID=266149 RepID=A0A0V0R6U2_PSEPJ|nr:hypothetical protein PPERSA_05272 [Pseudocohnilembus persalinus]|eukprot:KRX09880.1 hypothetical protein PPERSA_05272 [Pseudocohnilembus persalinus]
MSTQINTLIYILIIIFLCQTITYQKDYSSAWDIINEVEELAKKGALRAQILFEKRCESDIDACKYKQYDSCSTKMPDGMEIVHEELQLEGCDVKGMYVNYNTSGARCDNNEDCDSYDNKRIICSQAELFYDFYQYEYLDQDQSDNQNDDSDEDEDEDQENEFIIEQISIEDYEGLSDKIIEKYDPQLTSIKQSKDSQIVYQYAGFRNSYFNIYPFYHRPFVCDQCQEYDPRSRSWYIGGVTGAKNLVLILDISQSMAGKMNMAKNAALTVVESLTYSDYFQLILFNDDAETITGENVLIQATIENKAKFTSLIEEIQEKGGTNFEAAFVKAFNIMDETFDDESSGSDNYKNCLNVILFMTDGKISSGEDNQSLLLNMIATRNSYYKAFIFTYSLGTDADVDLPNQISCENRGICL